MSCGGEERQIWDAFIIDICVRFSTPKKPCTEKKISLCARQLAINPTSARDGQL